jgi:hypothetical protein
MYRILVSYFISIIFHFFQAFVSKYKILQETSALVFQVPDTIWVFIYLRSCPAEHYGERVANIQMPAQNNHKQRYIPLAPNIKVSQINSVKGVFRRLGHALSN